MATCIQARFRGMQARRFLLVFFREVIRVREIRFGASQRLQRLFRGWSARRRVEGLLVEAFKGQLLKEHLSSRRASRERKRRAELGERLTERYRTERAEERSARVTGLVHPSAAGGRKMAAFKESAYGHDAVSTLAEELVGSVRAVAAEEAREEEAGAERAAFVQARKIKGGRALQVYYADESRERSRRLIEKLTGGDGDGSGRGGDGGLGEQQQQQQRRRRNLIAAHNKKRLSFKYPVDVYIDPMLPLYEDTGIEPPTKKPSRRRRRQQEHEEQQKQKQLDAQ